jgi:hypothetical protein
MLRSFNIAGGKVRPYAAALLLGLTFGCAVALSTPTFGAATEGTTDPSLSPKAVQGLTQETAIPMPAYKYSLEGIGAENDYIAKVYPGWKKVFQSLVHDGGRFYDVIGIKSPAGEKKDIYFDITNWIGAELSP